jgi:hypothetical protein
MESYDILDKNTIPFDERYAAKGMGGNHKNE